MKSGRKSAEFTARRHGHHYGASGVGSMVVANRNKLGPARIVWNANSKNSSSPPGSMAIRRWWSDMSGKDGSYKKDGTDDS